MQHDYLILHGINLNMFGRRDPAVYGTATLEDINKLLYSYAGQMGVKIECYQTNSEAGFVERIHRSLDDGTRGIVVNAGAWTHYSYGILDALDILPFPVVEVHMSHVSGREEFRRKSVIAPACSCVRRIPTWFSLIAPLFLMYSNSHFWISWSM